MTHDIETQAAANKFLALSSGSLAAYLESCVHCGQCATACHFYEVTGDPKYTPAYKLFPMARATFIPMEFRAMAEASSLRGTSSATRATTQ